VRVGSAENALHDGESDPGGEQERAAAAAHAAGEPEQGHGDARRRQQPDDVDREQTRKMAPETDEQRRQGDARPKALGGDRRSGRIEAQAGLLRSLVEETPDITIEELREALVARGHSFGFGTIQRFFQRHRITRKKRRPTPASRTALTS